MKKMRICVLFLAFALVLCACVNLAGGKKYKVEIADDFPIANELAQTYAAGEEVTVQLETITEHYYTLTVNGEKQAMSDDSDGLYTYFCFLMPEEDVRIVIEDHWVDIPESDSE